MKFSTEHIKRMWYVLGIDFHRIHDTFSAVHSQKKKVDMGCDDVGRQIRRDNATTFQVPEFDDLVASLRSRGAVLVEMRRKFEHGGNEQIRMTGLYRDPDNERRLRIEGVTHDARPVRGYVEYPEGLADEGCAFLTDAVGDREEMFPFYR